MHFGQEDTELSSTELLISFREQEKQYIQKQERLRPENR